MINLTFHWYHSLGLIETIMLFAFLDMFMSRRWKPWYCLLPAYSILFPLQWIVSVSISGIINTVIAFSIDTLAACVYYPARDKSDVPSSSHKKRLAGRFFFLAMFYVLYLSCQAGGMLLLNFLLGYNLEDVYQQEILLIGAYTLGLLLLILVMLYCQRYRKITHKYLSNGHWLLLQVIPLASIAFMLLSFPFNSTAQINGAFRRSLIYFVVFIVAINVFVFYFYQAVSSASETKFENEMLKNLCRLQEQYTSSIVNSKLAQGDLLHDYIKNIRLIRTLNSSGNYMLANQHLEGLEKSIIDAQITKYTSNVQVDAILSSHLDTLKPLGIFCNWKGGILPTTLPFSSVHLNNLLGNAIINAGEACTEQNLKGNLIEIRIFFEQGLFTFLVRNPVKNPSPKAEYHRRGRGIEIMRNITKIYDGFLEVEQRDDCFTIKGCLLAPTINKRKK